MTHQLEYKFFVITLDRTPWRWKKIDKHCKAAGISCLKFTAVDGYKTEITDTRTGQSFKGIDVKNKIIQLEKRVPYQIKCDNGVVDPAEIILSADGDRFIAGNIGVWCSKALLRKEIIKHQYNNSIIFEDDFSLNPINFISAIEKLITNAPLNYSIIYLDSYLHKGSLNMVIGNKYITTFSKDAIWWGDWAHMLSYQGAVSLDYGNNYIGTSDNYSRKLAKGEIIRPISNQFEVYKASHNFSTLSSIQYSGFSNDSIITQMGCREFHKSSFEDCNQAEINSVLIGRDALMPIVSFNYTEEI